MSDLFTDPGAGGAPPPIAEAPPVIAPPPALPSAVPAEPLVPWVSIWTRPRATLRQVLEEDPRRWVFRLAALGGVAGALKLVSSSTFADSHSLSVVLAVCLGGGALGGIVALFLLTGLVGATGRWLGGRGGSTEVMAALAWSYVPGIWGLSLWLPLGALLGEEVFRAHPTLLEGNPPATLLFGFVKGVQLLIGFWGFIVSLKCVGEAHAFSAWRAFGALLVTGLILAVPYGIVVSITGR